MTTSGPAAPDRPEPRSRLVGVDLARGLAVLGMFVAHAAPTGDVQLWEALVRDVAAERSRLLFAVTAGLGLGLLTQARCRPTSRRAGGAEEGSGVGHGSVALRQAQRASVTSPDPREAAAAKQSRPQRPEPVEGRAHRTDADSEALRPAQRAGAGSADSAGGATGRAVPGRAALRLEIAIRALCLLVLGALLTTLDTPVRIILDEYGVAFLVVLPLVFLPARVLLGLGVGGVLLLPGVAAALAQVRAVRAQQVEPWGIVVEWFVTGAYPVLIWAPTLLLGVALVRLGLGRRRATLVGLAVAAAVAAVALPLGAQLVPPRQVAIGIATGGVERFAVATSLTVAGNVAAMLAVALALIALTTWLPASPRRLLVRLGAPLAAVGSMPLTVYVAQVLVLWLLTRGLGVPLGEDHWVVVGALTVGSLLLAWLWRRLAGRGPLEQLLGFISRPPARRTSR
ncbi:DUF418 domain-containing protein [Desertihabitans brevis]|uniref:DUF418 domain-containing protein n=1 Tax=Desertihabitans brevis TaxID=2268447 RepID=UPI0011BD516F|nr:DUF418 domain-containing protein [Desertihabitans brevis]